MTPSLAARREYVRNSRIIFLPFLCGTYSRSPVCPVVEKWITLGRKGHFRKNGSHLEKTVTLGKESHS